MKKLIAFFCLLSCLTTFAGVSLQEDKPPKVTYKVDSIDVSHAGMPVLIITQKTESLKHNKMSSETESIKLTVRFWVTVNSGSVPRVSQEDIKKYLSERISKGIKEISNPRAGYDEDHTVTLSDGKDLAVELDSWAEKKAQDAKKKAGVKP